MKSQLSQWLLKFLNMIQFVNCSSNITMTSDVNLDIFLELKRLYFN